jgi:hypothetical protein
MKILCVLSIAFFSVVSSDSQELAFLDVTNNVPSPRTHQPRVSSGAGGMVVPVDAAAIRQDRSLRIVLLPLARNAFQPGEDVIYEIKIENTGKQARIIPWDPNIADVEPTGLLQYGNKGYEYKLPDNKICDIVSTVAQGGISSDESLDKFSNRCSYPRMLTRVWHGEDGLSCV